MGERRGERRKVTWRCKCECGRETIVLAEKLRSGHTRSCGCLHGEKIAAGNPKHNGRHTPEYVIWQSMVKRCQNPKHISFKYYGERGISVSPAWSDFAQFYGDMGPRPSETHSIDRINVDGNYEPGNCRWATPKEQASNRRKRNV